MGPDMDKEIAALRRMPAGELRGKYLELFGEQSRSGNRDWLFRRCACRVKRWPRAGCRSGCGGGRWRWPTTPTPA